MTDSIMPEPGHGLPVEEEVGAESNLFYGLKSASDLNPLVKAKAAFDQPRFKVPIPKSNKNDLPSSVIQHCLGRHGKLTAPTPLVLHRRASPAEGPARDFRFQAQLHSRLGSLRVWHQFTGSCGEGAIRGGHKDRGNLAFCHKNARLAR